MIEYTVGDILQSGREAEALVNPVNCVGVMGRGLALQFKKAYPDNFEAYTEACKKNSVRTGKMFVYETKQPANPRYIINFPTKQHWRKNSRIEYIEDGLADLVVVIREKNIRSITIPPLGCGLGGLAWNDVKPLITAALEPLAGVRAILFEPSKTRHTPKVFREKKQLLQKMQQLL